MFRSFLRNLLGGVFAVQMRRFVIVGTFAAGVQQALLWVLNNPLEMDYIVASVISIEITIVLAYVLNDAWTFQSRQNSGTVPYLIGMLKTNIVRGTAIPIQVGILVALVEWVGLPVLIANGIAIPISGIYRFILDRQWTWG
jgi:putative flippase GtrA